MRTRAHSSSPLSRPRATRSEEGFTLTELVIAIGILLVLTALVIPALLLQQQAAAKNNVITDVKALQTRIASSLFPNPTADPILGYYQGTTAPSVPIGGIAVAINRNDGSDKIVITNAVNDGTSATAASGTGSWRGYEITGTNPRVPNWYYTYNSLTGKYTTNSTNDASTNPLPTKVPTFTTNSLPTAVKNTNYSAAINTTAQPAATFTATGLPAGLTINATSGTISGIPTADGAYTVYVTATNTVGTTTKSYNLLVQSVPAVTSTSLPAGISGNTYSYQVTATGVPAPTFTATGLPTGLTIDPSTGLIAGTISSSVSGTFTVRIQVANSAGSSATNLALVVNGPPTITTTSLPTATKGTAYSTTIQATGYPSPTFTLTGTSTGLTLDPNTGLLSGTPNVSGQYNLTVTVTNPAGNASKTLILTINSAAAITTTSLPAATLNSAYTGQVTANGYPAPTYALTAGSLPTGLNINTTSGAITGTPTASGSYTFTITATNVTNGTTNTDSKNYTIAVNSAPAITTSSLNDGLTGQTYNQTVATTGYPAPTYTATTSTWIQCATENSTCTLPDSTTRQVRFGGNGSYIYQNISGGSTSCSNTTFGSDPLPGISKYCYYLGTPSTTLPAGITFNTNTGAFTGTPTNNNGFTLNVTAANSTGSAQKSYNVNFLTKLAPVTNVTQGKIFGNQATTNWTSPSNATNYTITYSGGGSGTRTISGGTGVTDTQTINASPNSIGVSVIARGSGYYADSDPATTTITMPGYRAAAGTVLNACGRYDQTLTVNANCAITSTDGTWTSVMQSDGNFVLYKNNLSNGTVAAWGAINNGVVANSYASVQTDGNFVLYGPSSAIQATNTYGNSNVRLDMQTDGNLVLYNSGGGAIWGMYNVGGGNTRFMQYVGGSNVSIVDPNAETCDSNTWHTYYGPGTTCATDQYTSGSHSWKITTTGNNPEGIINGPNNINVAAGQRVLITLLVRGTPGESWAVGGRQGNPYNEGMSGYTLITDGTWQRISVIWTAPSGGYQTPYIQMRQNNQSSGKYIYSDDITTYVGF